MNQNEFQMDERKGNLYLKEYVHQVYKISHASKNHKCCRHGPIKNYAFIILHPKTGKSS